MRTPDFLGKKVSVEVETQVGNGTYNKTNNREAQRKTQKHPHGRLLADARI
jgi:hypothetical protein